MKLQCPIEKKCGGCQYLAMNYEKQLSIKQDKIIKLIGKYARVNKIVGMEDYLHYRNKINATFKYKKSGIISGVYEEGTHNVLPVDKCFIEDEKADEIIASIRKLIPSFKITVYNEDTGYGLLRHVMIRVGKNSGQIMVVLVTSNPIFPSKKNFANALKKLHPEITTIVQNINDKKTSMVLGPRNQVMLGKGFIEDTLCGMKFKISPNSFYQINVEQTEKLYNLAIEYAGLTGKEKVVDAYCGIGTIGLVASKKAKQVIGVELNKEAVKDAIINAKINDCNNIKFYGNDAGKFMVDMAAKGEKADVVFMDPPRSGSDKPFLDSVIKLAPERIVYISCGPESLARDLDYIVKNSEYKVEKITPVDMFPCTEHVETVCLLSKLHEAKHHVNVTVDMDEMDITSAESKATYEEIKKYVAEHNDGMKVSNLYIAQVKAKYGIIERENYNLPKSGDAKQPQCPKEKEDAIADALRFFRMI